MSHATTHEGRYGADFATQQRPARVLPGGLVLAAIVAVLVAGAAALVLLDATVPLVAGALLEVGAASLLAGLFVVAPNEAMVLVLFGRYVGTVDRPGFYWANPFTALWRETISLRVRNFQSERTKVNDASGSPIEIAAVIVWRVVDTARAVFDVEDFREFVVVQGETAIRHLATQYPYDDFDGLGPSLRANADDDFDGLGPSLRANADAVSRTLHAELQDRLAAAGIEVLEARLTHLAYAPEIAEAMLRRQQASAIVAARRTIVHGAVGLVEMALREIAQEGIVELDEERRAAMVSNLMVVLTGDRAPTPVINAGTLYS